jgi:hypothetical protein
MNTEEIINSIAESLPNIKKGTLRFWGDWFGRPYDNVHMITGAERISNGIKILFDNDEMLSIVNPGRASINENEFVVLKAKSIKWEWYSYGKEKTDKNKYCILYENMGNEIIGKSNEDWYTHIFETDIHEPAVKIY